MHPPIYFDEKVKIFHFLARVKSKKVVPLVKAILVNFKYCMKKNTTFDTVWPYLMLISIVILVYCPVINHNFLYQWDDQWVVMNHYTTGGININNLWYILTDFYHGQYAPFNEES